MPELCEHIRAKIVTAMREGKPFVLNLGTERMSLTINESKQRVLPYWLFNYHVFLDKSHELVSDAEDYDHLG